MKSKKIKSNEANFAAGGAVMGGQNTVSKFSQILSTLSFNLFKSKPVIAVLRLEGVIGKVGIGNSGMTLNSLDELISKTFATDKLAAVCLVINSPGGSPVQSDLIHKRITSLAKEKNVPIYSFIEDVGASGGYWLAAAGKEIYASRSSIIGSIGVVSRGFGFSDAIKKIGIDRRVHTQGENKSILDPFKPEKKEDINIITDIQKDIHQHFIEAIKDSRGGRLTQNDDLLFNGKFWSGVIALDYGLIDGIDDLYSFINERFGGNVKIEHIKPKQSWFKKKLGVQTKDQDIAASVTRELVNILENKVKFDKFDLS